jgi:hypothetical protein
MPAPRPSFRDRRYARAGRAARARLRHKLIAQLVSGRHAACPASHGVRVNVVAAAGDPVPGHEGAGRALAGCLARRRGGSRSWGALVLRPTDRDRDTACLRSPPNPGTPSLRPPDGRRRRVRALLSAACHVGRQRDGPCRVIEPSDTCAPSPVARATSPRLGGTLLPYEECGTAVDAEHDD